VGVVICLEQGADLHMAQLMPLPLTVSCSGKIQIGFALLVPALLRSSGKGQINVCVCVCVCCNVDGYKAATAGKLNSSMGKYKHS